MFKAMSYSSWIRGSLTQPVPTNKNSRLQLAVKILSLQAQVPGLPVSAGGGQLTMSSFKGSCTNSATPDKLDLLLLHVLGKEKIH